MWSWGNKKEQIESEEINFESLGFDFDKIGIIDENQIEVSESDLNDPHLLAELNNLHHFDEEEGDLVGVTHQQQQQQQSYKQTTSQNQSQNQQVGDLLSFDDIQISTNTSTINSTTNNKKNNSNHEEMNLLQEINFSQTISPAGDINANKKNNNSVIENEITNLKVRALALRKEGKKTEAIELLKQVKLLQSQLPPTQQQPQQQRQQAQQQGLIEEPIKNIQQPTQKISNQTTQPIAPTKPIKPTTISQPMQIQAIESPKQPTITPRMSDSGKLNPFSFLLFHSKQTITKQQQTNLNFYQYF